MPTRSPRAWRGRKFAAAEDVPQIQPQPGGIRREYWLQAETRNWEITPLRKDEWHNRRSRAATPHRAFIYREMTPGFAEYKHAVSIPGPTLVAEVGDVLVVHFRNADTKLNQAVTVHPHGVKYNPEYDGAYMGDVHARRRVHRARARRSPTSGSACPESVGVWPYHDHGPNHMLNTFRGLFGAIIVRARGRQVAGRRRTTLFAALSCRRRSPGCARTSSASTAARTPATRRRCARKVGQDVEFNAFGMDATSTPSTSTVTAGGTPRGPLSTTRRWGPTRSVTARFIEDNPGRWLYHCHVFPHQDAGMAGWYVVDP